MLSLLATTGIHRNAYCEVERMKKLLYSSIMLAVVLCLVGCEKLPDYAYSNESYGFAFAPPEYWENAFVVKEIDANRGYYAILFSSEYYIENSDVIGMPTLFTIHVFSKEEGKQYMNDPRLGDGPFIEHRKRDVGLWIMYPDEYVPDSEYDQYVKLFDDIRPENIEKYLYFTD